MKARFDSEFLTPQIPLANSEMSDKLQFVVAFGSGRMAETSDKLQFVEHFRRRFALLQSLPTVSPHSPLPTPIDLARKLI